MSKLLILGAGGHGKVAAETALLSGQWETVSFLDDKAGVERVLGIPVIGKLEDYALNKTEYSHAFVAIGNNRLRMEWLQRLGREGFQLPVLQHPSSVISGSCRIGEGTIVMAGTVINADAEIGKGCIINTSSSVDHDCQLADGVHVSPGAHVGGTVQIGSNSWICIGASVANNVTIGSNTVVAAGAAVITDVPDQVLAAGVPARKIKDLN